MHRIRLHGPWKVRLVQKPRLPLETSMVSEYDRKMEADGLLAAAGPEAILLLEQTIQLPSEWDRWRNSHPLGVDQAYELRRAFGQPTGLKTGQEVWLALTGLPMCKLWLNESRLISDSTSELSELDSNSAGELRFPIAKRLLAKNRLLVWIENDSDQPSALVLKSICLEIDEPGSSRE